MSRLLIAQLLDVLMTFSDQRTQSEVAYNDRGRLKYTDLPQASTTDQLNSFIVRNLRSVCENRTESRSCDPPLALALGSGPC